MPDASIRAELERYAGFLEQDPANPRLAAEVVERHMQLGDREAAEAVLDRGLRATPGDPRLLGLLGTLALAARIPSRRSSSFGIPSWPRSSRRSSRTTAASGSSTTCRG